MCEFFFGIVFLYLCIFFTGEQGMIIGFIDDSNPLRQFHGYLNESATKAKMIHNVFEKGQRAFASGKNL